MWANQHDSLAACCYQPCTPNDRNSETHPWCWMGDVTLRSFSSPWVPSKQIAYPTLGKGRDIWWRQRERERETLGKGHLSSNIPWVGSSILKDISWSRFSAQQIYPHFVLSLDMDWGWKMVDPTCRFSIEVFNGDEVGNIYKTKVFSIWSMDIWTDVL